MSKALLKKIEYWRPLTEVITGSLGLVISVIALAFSGYAVYLSQSGAEITAHPGRHFGVAELRGNHLPDWDLPHVNYPEERRYLVCDMGLVFSNSGGKRGVIDHISLDIRRASDGRTLRLDWSLYFSNPTLEGSQEAELVTPLVVEGNASEKRLIRFLSSHDADVSGFFKEGDAYTYSFGIHTADMKQKPDDTRIISEHLWTCDENDHFNIKQKTYAPDDTSDSGETALLMLY